MNNILKILKLAKPLYRLVALSAFLILAGALMNLIIPFAAKYAVDEITAQLSNGTGDVNRLFFFVGLGFALNIVSIILSGFSDRIGDKFAVRMRQFLTETFYNKILSLPQNYFDSEISGKILNQLTRGIQSIQDFINTSTNFILPAILQSALTVIILARFNLALGFFIAILFPVFIIITRYSVKRWGRYEGIKNEIDDKARGRISEVVSNIRLVKGYTNEKNEYNLISGNLSEITKLSDKQSIEFHILDFIRNSFLNIILLIINLIIFYKTFTGEFSVGDLVLLVTLIAQARWPLFGMSSILEQIQRADTGSKEYLDILASESTEDYNLISDEPKITDPVLEFKDVGFSYDDKHAVINNISFRLVKNEVVALVGPSGAGKSTIINLILKFYEPKNGEISLNDKSYKELSHQFIRRNIALVFQENELFSSTIRENVAYGNPGATDEQVIDALKKSNAYDFVMNFQDGINAEIGERGVRLSGGQKQRIQIARAILKDAPILILDEATSNLDAKSEFEVQDALEKLMNDRLTIIIAHRFSTLQNATKVIVINDHKIEDMGTPQDLAKHEGIYSELLHYQVEGNKKLLKKFEIY